jgi:SAM-dependent methyltransferase
MSSYRCRICGAAEHELVLDYGRVALADSFLRTEAERFTETKYQLTLVFCRACAHVQIMEILDPSMLFSEYVWETGIPASIKEYCRTFADRVLGNCVVRPGSTVVELASNDGTMLREFKSRGFDVVGVDPAKNIARRAEQSGIPTVPAFFNERVASDLARSKGRVDLVIARNVLAHVADLHGFAEGLRALLSDDGVAVIEVPHLLTLFDELQYDQVFHEHIGYHSLDSICRLCERHGLRVVDVDTAWVHGGSIRAYVTLGSAGRGQTDAVGALLAKERDAGILAFEGWKGFADRVLTQKRLLRDELRRVTDGGGIAAGYGASGKGQSMIQFCELDGSLVKFIADKSTMKIGKLTPGSHIPIKSPEEMRAQRVDVLVLFAWNFADEVLRQESGLKAKGVRFLHPIPVPHYL